MATGSAELHEAAEHLESATIDRHRGIVSLMEELEAIDWYDQRLDAVEDRELRGVLEHNRDEEKEHAAMALEWLRRQDPIVDWFLRQYLFTDGPIAHDPTGESDGQPRVSAPAKRYSLGVGSLQGRRTQ